MKNKTAIILLLSLFFIAALTASAQEMSAVSSSSLTGISLPAGAQKIAPHNVPPEITETLDKIIAEGGGKFRQGETEVLVWAGAKYSKASAGATVDRLTAALKNAGWDYTIAGSEDGVEVFGATKKSANPRMLLGFHGATDDALVFTWMEVLPSENGGAANDQTENISGGRAENSPKTGNSGSIVGTWTNGNVSTLSEQNLSTGAISSRGGSTFKYVFNANGTFEFVGLMNSTMYGCTTSLFNDKRGRYEISGSQLTLIPSKNFWRNQNSCSPASTKEQNYKLDAETYSFRTRTDEYGKTLVCLDSGKGEACYRKEE